MFIWYFRLFVVPGIEPKIFHVLGNFEFIIIIILGVSRIVKAGKGIHSLALPWLTESVVWGRGAMLRDCWE